jgi:ABC-type transport system involved in Fe-S cluster assembly fused permease/ATPase subunit
MRMYDPQDGVVPLDERDMRFLDEEWMKGHIVGVGQQGVLILDGRFCLRTLLLVRGWRMGGRVWRKPVELR